MSHEIKTDARFARFVSPEPNTGCWLWMGALADTGYGYFSLRGRHMLAHRASWTLAHGEIPRGLMIDHMCRVRSCVNPAHLRLVTPRENTISNSESIPAANVLKTHCAHGHLLSGPNVRVTTAGRGWAKNERVCLACQNDRQARWNRAQREGNRVIGHRECPVCHTTIAWRRNGCLSPHSPGATRVTSPDRCHGSRIEYRLSPESSHA